MKSINWSSQEYADKEAAIYSNTGSYKKEADFMNIDTNALSMMISEHLISPPESKLLNQQSEMASLPLLFTSTKGNAEFDALVGPIGIPVASKNKVLAWMFIRYFLFEMDCDGVVPYAGGSDRTYFGPTPVNRRMANEMMEATFEKDSNVIGKLNDWFSTVDTYSLLTVNLSLMNSTNEVFHEYINSNLLSAEECAQKLEEKIQIYFKE